MFSGFRRLWGQFFRKTRTINAEPLNKVSLIVVIVIDIFILTNVFMGLNDISSWHLSPSQAYPCYTNWANYQTDETPEKDYNLIRQSLADSPNTPTGIQDRYQQNEIDHLGTVSPVCLQYGGYQDQVNQPDNILRQTTIDQKQNQIFGLEEANRTIRAQYDSSLLEEIAGQDRELSINEVAAADAKRTLEANERAIATLKTEISTVKAELLAEPNVTTFLTFLNTEATFDQIEKDYQQASFWYPTIQFGFQAAFLLPLIILALLVHRWATNRNYGLVALISWHLLIIFFIPLIFKVFEFLQVGLIFRAIFDVVRYLFGGLLFLVSYLYILAVPLIGFGVIKFFQKIVFNPKSQAAGRAQKSSCLRCAKKIQPQDDYCPHCGFGQHVDCANCHQPTFKYLSYCRHCGHNPQTGLGVEIDR